jgi:Na+-driven multidrug efflux pump
MWLLPGVVGYAALSLFTSALLATSSPGLSSLGPLSSLIVSIVLDVMLIPHFGASGAAVAATVAFLVGGAVATTLYRRRAAFGWRDLLPRKVDVRDLWQLGRGLPSRFR